MWSRSTAASCLISSPSTSAGSRNRIGSPCISVTPLSAVTFVTLPPYGAVTRCSIFIDSMMAICCPGRTRSPSATSIVTTVPCRGADTGSDPTGPVTLAAKIPTASPGSTAGCEEQRPHGLLRCSNQRGDMDIDEIGSNAVGGEIGMGQHRLNEGNVGGNARNAKFAQGTRRLLHHIGPARGCRMNDDLGEQENRMPRWSCIRNSRRYRPARPGRTADRTARASRPSASSPPSRPSLPC